MTLSENIAAWHFTQDHMPNVRLLITCWQVVVRVLEEWPVFYRPRRGYALTSQLLVAPVNRAERPAAADHTEGKSQDLSERVQDSTRSCRRRNSLKIHTQT